MPCKQRGLRDQMSGALDEIACITGAPERS
jgi:hypothetical protein